MTPAQRLATRFREVLLNGTWIANTNFQDKLSTVTWEQAMTKIGSLNTLALLTFHIHYYIAGVLEVLKGGDLTIRDKYSFDLPRILARRIGMPYVGIWSLIPKSLPLMSKHSQKKNWKALLSMRNTALIAGTLKASSNNATTTRGRSL